MGYTTEPMNVGLVVTLNPLWFTIFYVFVCVCASVYMASQQQSILRYSVEHSKLTISVINMERYLSLLAPSKFQSTPGSQTLDKSAKNHTFYINKDEIVLHNLSKILNILTCSQNVCHFTRNIPQEQKKRRKKILLAHNRDTISIKGVNRSDPE